MPESDAERPWDVLGIAGVPGVCCIGTTALAGGAALAGGRAADMTATSGTTGGLAGITVAGFATALPLLVLGLFLRQRAQNT